MQTLLQGCAQLGVFYFQLPSGLRASELKLNKIKTVWNHFPFGASRFASTSNHDTTQLKKGSHSKTFLEGKHASMHGQCDCCLL
jgi:hypothetical protein